MVLGMISERSVNEIIETGIGSIAKIKIIKMLSTGKKFHTIYGIQKRTNLKRDDIKRNLKDLIVIGWIKEQKMNTVLYYVNKDNNYVEKLVKFFKDVGYIDEVQYN